MKKSIYYLLAIILLGIITGVVVIFIVFNQASNIYVKSIDRTIEFSLGEIKVEEINIQINYIENETTFTVKDIEEFEQLIYDNPYYIDTYTYDDKIVHLFVYESYTFLLHDQKPWYKLSTDESLIASTDVIFPFFTNTYISDDMFVSYSNQYNIFDSFLDAQLYYLRISPIFALIDEDEQKIYINCIYTDYDAYIAYGIT
ncbi:MAG: hypothetical protein WCR19_05565, partial [Acholeplasmataceae bacterium]